MGIQKNYIPRIRWVLEKNYKYPKCRINQNLNKNSGEIETEDMKNTIENNNKKKGAKFSWNYSFPLSLCSLKPKKIM